MATSITPTPSPNTKDSASSQPYDPASAGPSKVTAENGPANQHTRRLVHRSTSGPAASIDTSAPAEISSSALPRLAGPSWSRSLSDGNPDAHTPITKPLRKKREKTPSRARLATLLFTARA